MKKFFNLSTALLTTIFLTGFFNLHCPLENEDKQSAVQKKPMIQIPNHIGWGVMWNAEAQEAMKEYSYATWITKENRNLDTVGRSGSIFITKIQGKWYFVLGVKGIYELTEKYPFPALSLFAAGSREKDESILATTQRETFEETGKFVRLPITSTLQHFPCVTELRGKRLVGDKLLFVVVLHPESLKTMAQKCAEANCNKHLDTKYREIAGYVLAECYQTNFKKKGIKISDNRLAELPQRISFLPIDSKLENPVTSPFLREGTVLGCDRLYRTFAENVYSDICAIINKYDKLNLL